MVEHDDDDDDVDGDDGNSLMMVMMILRGRMQMSELYARADYSELSCAQICLDKGPQ